MDQSRFKSRWFPGLSLERDTTQRHTTKNRGHHEEGEKMRGRSDTEEMVCQVTILN